MTTKPSIGVAYPPFLAVFHLPGLRLARPVMNVGGVSLQEISWREWVVVEESDLAFRLHGVFERERPVFCPVQLIDFIGSFDEAEEIRETCERNLEVLIAALRLHKKGPVVDLDQTTRYLRIKELNIRRPGLYGHRLFERPFTERYEIQDEDLSDISEIHENLKGLAVDMDPGIALALRHFSWSYFYQLPLRHRLTLLYMALEATFGEYKLSTRTDPKTSLGKAAAVVSRSSNPANVATMLDDGDAGRGLRNYIAHGATTIPPMPMDLGLDLVEGAVRDGLRALVRFGASKENFIEELDLVSHGLSACAPKDAFQKLLAHAARGSAKALDLARQIVT